MLLVVPRCFSGNTPGSTNNGISLSNSPSLLLPINSSVFCLSDGVSSIVWSEYTSATISILTVSIKGKKYIVGLRLNNRLFH